MGCLCREYRDARKIPLNVEHRMMLGMAPDYDHLMVIQKVEVFEHALDSTSGAAPSSPFFFSLFPILFLSFLTFLFLLLSFLLQLVSVPPLAAPLHPFAPSFSSSSCLPFFLCLPCLFFLISGFCSSSSSSSSLLLHSLLLAFLTVLHV